MVQEDHLWYTFLQLNPLSSKSHTDTVEGCFILFSVTILCWYIEDDKCNGATGQENLPQYGNEKENFMIDTAVSITSIRNPITMQNQTAILGAIALRAGDQL